MIRPHPQRPRVAGQAGVGLIEVIVSAAILLMVTAAVLSAIDNAQTTSGRTAGTAVASNIAQQDQERLRALRTSDLSNKTEQRTVSVKGVDYAVTSTATFVQDSTEMPGCSSTSSASFLRITSSVKSRLLKTPVELTSFVNPGIGAFGDSTGNLVVKLTGATGNPIGGTSVSISGPASATQVTSSTDGCAFFGYIPAGSYTISYATPGFVSPDLVQAVSFTDSVTAGATRVIQRDYDRAASITAQPFTRVGTTEQAGQTEAASVQHSTLSTQLKTYPPATSPASSVPLTGLYPRTSPYRLFSGNCLDNIPPASVWPSGYSPDVATTAGGSSTARIFEPAIDVTVKNGSSLVSGATVVMTETKTGCADRVVQKTGSTGKVPDPGLPYSTWTVCAQSGTRAKTVTGITNNAAAGVAQTLDLATGVNGACA